MRSEHATCASMKGSQGMRATPLDPLIYCSLARAGLRSVLGVVQPDADDGLRLERRQHLADLFLVRAEHEAAEEVLLHEEPFMRGSRLWYTGLYRIDRLLHIINAPAPRGAAPPSGARRRRCAARVSSCSTPSLIVVWWVVWWNNKVGYTMGRRCVMVP